MTYANRFPFKSLNRIRLAERQMAARKASERRLESRISEMLAKAEAHTKHLPEPNTDDPNDDWRESESYLLVKGGEVANPFNDPRMP